MASSYNRNGVFNLYAIPPFLRGTKGLSFYGDVRRSKAHHRAADLPQIFCRSDAALTQTIFRYRISLHFMTLSSRLRCGEDPGRNLFGFCLYQYFITKLMKIKNNFLEYSKTSLTFLRSRAHPIYRNVLLCDPYCAYYHHVQKPIKQLYGPIIVWRFYYHRYAARFTSAHPFHMSHFKFHCQQYIHIISQRSIVYIGMAPSQSNL